MLNVRSLFIKHSSVYWLLQSIKNRPATLSEISFRNKSSDKSLTSRHQLKIYSCEEKLTPAATVKVISSFDVHVQPLSVDRSRATDVALIEIIANGEQVKNENELRKMISFEIQKSPSFLNIKCESDRTLGFEFSREANKLFMLVMHLPTISSLNVKTQSRGNISVSEMNLELLTVSTDAGGIRCKELKCGEIYLVTVSGNVQCTGVIWGKVKIRARVGSVTGNHFQGNMLHVTTEHGTINISAVDANRSCFQTKTGNISLENYHGNGMVVSEEGNLSVSSLDGSLQAEMGKGNTDIQVNQFHSLHLMNKQGNIKVNIPETLQASLELQGKQLKIEKHLCIQGAIERKENQQLLSGFLGAGKGPLMKLFSPFGTIIMTSRIR